MKNLINLNSTEWCDIVFADRNKEYGAYIMRQESGKNHLMAFGITILFAVAVSTLPVIISWVMGNKDITKLETYKGNYSLSKLDNEKVVEIILPEVKAPKPIKEKAAIKFTPPTIVDDMLVTDKNRMNSVENIKGSKLTISVVGNPDGSLDKDAVLIELQNRRNVIVEQTTDEGPKDVVEIMPQYPGGASEMYKYIHGLLKYPVPAQDAGIQGKVIVRFVVSKTGEIRDAKIMRGIDSSCDAEALRVIGKMPKWVPGKQNGRAVAVYFTIPIVFMLNTK